MKVLLVYTNINGFHDDNYSFGLASIASSARKAGHEVKVIIVNTVQCFQKIKDALFSFNPNVIGFSSVSSQFSFVKDFAKELKTMRPEIIVVCGGVHPTIWPECILETDALDAVFIGESELAFVEFLEKVARKEPYQLCDNVAYVKQGLLFRNKCKGLIDNLDVLPFPDREVYPYMETLEKTVYAPFHFSRGCPFPCTYCSNHAIAKANGREKSSSRFPSPEYCIREIEETINNFKMIRTIAIVDDIFGLNKRWRDNFLDLYKKKIKIPFMCLLRADIVNEKFIKDLKNAGCYRISFGIESGNEYVRNEIMKRKMGTDAIINAFDLCRKYAIETNAINIIGVPGETEEMFLDTINLNRKIRPTSTGVNIFYPYHGTILGDYCFKNDLVDLKKLEDFSNERRDTVLNYPADWCDKLLYYHREWLYVSEK
ncbi:MAG: B12-binding protein [Magnetococcales bacterium]|nr:B12-binding protein [Magnetococcales bacterium]